MQINSINFNNSTATSSKPTFKGIARVSNVILNDRTVAVKYPKFRSIIDKAVKFLKTPENKNIDFVKKFWGLMEPDNSSLKLKRTGAYLVSGKDAQELEDAAMDIKFYGDMSAYKDIKSDFIHLKKHVSAKGVEQEIFVKSHLDNKKRIVIDEVGFKNKGESMRNYNTFKNSAPQAPQPLPFLPSSKLDPKPKESPVLRDKSVEKYLVSTIPDWPARYPKSDVVNATSDDKTGQFLFKF